MSYVKDCRHEEILIPQDPALLQQRFILHKEHGFDSSALLISQGSRAH